MSAEMEPDLATAPELAGILEELIAHEPIFHRLGWGTARADFERITTEDFWEIGASGRRYSRAYILDELEKRFAQPREENLVVGDYHCRQLAPNLYLLTYNLLQPGDRKTRRTTIWQRKSDGWKIVFHQGTIIQGE